MTPPRLAVLLLLLVASACLAAACQLVVQFDRVASKEEAFWCADGLDNDGDAMIDDLDSDCGLAEKAFASTVLRAVTILVVIDNSGSMCEEQFRLGPAMWAFLSGMRAAAPGVRFHAGVITTDTVDVLGAGRLNDVTHPVVATALCPTPPPLVSCTDVAPLPRWVDETTPNPEHVFECLGQVGVAGFGAEAPLGAARMALGPDLLGPGGWNEGFALPGSVLVLVFVTDEDDCSVCGTSACTPLLNLEANLHCYINRIDELTPVEDLAASIRAAWAAARAGGDADAPIIVTSILGLDAKGNAVIPVIPAASGADAPEPICSAAGQGVASPALRLHEFTQLFAGEEFSICDSEYGVDLSTTAARTVATVGGLCLTETPCPNWVSTLTVYMDGVQVPPTGYTVTSDASCPGGWRVSANGEFVSGTELLIEYGTGPGACD